VARSTTKVRTDLARYKLVDSVNLLIGVVTPKRLPIWGTNVFHQHNNERRDNVNRSDAKPTTIKLPSDVRAILMAWAADNLSSMSSEVIRSVRDRAQREREAAAA
jgi:hypothetical protein